MVKQAHCAECGSYVLLDETGTCPGGHSPPSYRDVRDVSETGVPVPLPDSPGPPPGRSFGERLPMALKLGWWGVLALWLGASLGLGLWVRYGVHEYPQLTAGLVWLGVCASVLPAFTLQSRAARISFAVLSGLVAFSAGSLIAWSRTPGIEMMVVLPLAGLTAVSIACVIMFGIGIGGAVSQVIARLRKRPTPWYVTCALGLVVTVLLIGVPYAQRKNAAEEVVNRGRGDVIAARDSATPQSRSELASRVVDTLQTAADRGSLTNDKASARELLKLWHPGTLKNDEYGSYREGPYVQDEQIVGYIANVVLRSAMEPWEGGELGLVQRGDRFVASWQREVALTDVDGYTRILLTFTDGQNVTNGGVWVDGPPIFPGATYQELVIDRSRGQRAERFLVCYAVNDRGKWWLVGAIDPRGEQDIGQGGPMSRTGAETTP